MPEQLQPFEPIPNEHPMETVERFPEGGLKDATKRLLEHALERRAFSPPRHPNRTGYGRDTRTEASV